jgi:arabinogalactan endo-1,4-beta-galactosidase
MAQATKGTLNYRCPSCFIREIDMDLFYDQAKEEYYCLRCGFRGLESRVLALNQTARFRYDHLTNRVQGFPLHKYPMLPSFIKGADISTLLEMEALGARYYDDGSELDLITILKNNNINLLRLRLWVNPYDEQGLPYHGGKCDLKSMLTLAERASKQGLHIMLALHYSDFWADPGKQIIPKAWQGLSLNDLKNQVKQYTESTLQAFKDAHIHVSYIQIGNEITNGMLWPLGQLKGESGTPRTGYQTFGSLLKAGIEGAKSVFPHSRLLAHLERTHDQVVYQEWLDEIIINQGLPFDTLAVSYYPFWHGSFDQLTANLKMVKERYKLPIIIGETSYPFTEAIYSTDGVFPNGLVMDAIKIKTLGLPMPYPFSLKGQIDFIHRLLDLCNELKLQGVVYWEPAWLPVLGSQWTSQAGLKYIKEDKPMGNEWANQCLFDYDGVALPALKVIKNFQFKGENK